MVIWVKEKELEKFMPLIPEEQHEYLKNEDWFCLGALSGNGSGGDDEDELIPSGVIVFSNEEGISFGKEPASVIEIKWLYVAERFRLKGVANELMQAFSGVTEDSPAEGVICDIPFDSEYDLAEAFFVSWGYVLLKIYPRRYSRRRCEI